MARLALAALALFACRETAPMQPLYPAGDDRDEGHGQLARASTSLITDEDKPARTSRAELPRRYRDDDGDPADGNTYGGPGYGGASYASYRPPPWTYPTAARPLHYTARAGLSGAVEGTITWDRKAATVTTTCGKVQLHRTTEKGALPGAVVYVDDVKVGRTVVHETGEHRPYTVGGTVVKRGCDLLPRIQVVSPVPAAITIHGDAQPTQLEIESPRNTVQTQELQEGGRIVIPASQGLTKIEAVDGSLGAAWVLGLTSSYYAISDDRGRYRIEELAPGTYVIKFQGPPTTIVVDGKLEHFSARTIERTVRVETNRTTRLDVVLDR